MTIGTALNARAMLDNQAAASDAHNYACAMAVSAMLGALRDLGPAYANLPQDDRLAEVEGVISNYLLEAGIGQ